MRSQLLSRQRRLATFAAAALVVGGLAGATPLTVAALPAGVAPAPGVITTWAGGTGEGPALNVSVRPTELAARGPYVYITDDGSDAARVLDTRTGELRTVAGNGDPETWADQTPRRDGEPATVDRIAQPAGVAVDAAGHVYVSDYYDGTVRAVDTAGIISTYAGGGNPSDGKGDGGAATQARLSHPSTMTLDGAGNLLVVDGESEVRRVSPLGIITTVAGRFCGCGNPPIEDVPATEASLHMGAIAIDPSGHLYLAHDDRVLRVDDAGVVRRYAGGGSPADGLGDGGPATQAALSPSAMAFDPAGNLYLADVAGNRVRRVDTAGVITTVAGGAPETDNLGDGGPATSAALNHPEGVTVGAGGDLYISDTGHLRVRRVSGGVITTVAGSGASLMGGDGGPATKAQFFRPSGMARDAVGNTYVADTLSQRIRRIDGRSGIVTTVAGSGLRGLGGDGGPATAAQLFEPKAIAVDRSGNLFLTESSGDRVRRVGPDGTITTFAGGGSAVLGDGGQATDAALAAPSGLAVDAAGNLYIADTGHDRVRKVTPQGVISTVAGGADLPDEYYPGNPGDSGDDRPATSARLWLSASSTLAFDPLGQLHISAAHRVRKVDLAGIITTVAGTAYFSAGYFEGSRATEVGLGTVTGMAFDANGSLYVAAADAGKIFMVDTMGRVRTVGGTGDVYTGLGEGGPATKARIDVGYSGMAFDASGSLYVTDPGTNRIRHIESPTAPTKVLATGWNGVGQLGDGTIVDRHAPVAVVGLSNVKAVSAGYYHDLAVRADGTVWAWGWNYFGQLGDGTTTDRRVPVQVPGLDHIIAVAGGAYHSLALRADGAVWAWGWNGIGQLGDGTTVDRHAPVRLTGVTNVKAIAAGGFHSLAAAHDGTLLAWGWNALGQLGTGSGSLFEPAPVNVPGASGVVSVAAGALHSLVVRRIAGISEVWAWGWNGVGQVGDGTTVERHAPVRVYSQPGEVWAGAYQSFSGDGLYSAWGYNEFGALGVPSAEAVVTTPTWMTLPRQGGAIASGILHTAVVTFDRSVVASGWNGYGALGDGTVVDRRTQSVVPGVAGAQLVAAGALHTLIVK